MAKCEGLLTPWAAMPARVQIPPSPQMHSCSNISGKFFQNSTIILYRSEVKNDVEIQPEVKSEFEAVELLYRALIDKL